VVLVVALPIRVKRVVAEPYRRQATTSSKKVTTKAKLAPERG